MPDDRALVLSANLAFYRAFSAHDLVAMRDVWAGTPTDICIHPGWDVARGWAAIQATWASIFASDTPVVATPEQVSVDIWGDVARVVLVERVSAAGEEIGQVAATNLFLRTAAGWKLTLHHGSPIAAPADEPEDLN